MGSAKDGVPLGGMNTTFQFASCFHDETQPLIQSIWNNMRDEGILPSRPEGSLTLTAPQLLKVISVLPCLRCHTKETPEQTKASREKTIKGWLVLPREDTPATRVELAWIGYALECLGSKKRPHLTRWAYVTVELLGADVTLQLAACFRDSSHPDGPLRGGDAAHCLMEGIEDYERRKQVREAREVREDGLERAWTQFKRSAGILGQQLVLADSGISLDLVNEAGKNFQGSMMLYGTLVEEIVKMPEGLLNSSKAPRDGFDVQMETQELDLQKDEVTAWVEVGRRLPSETRLEMLLPLQTTRPGEDQVFILRAAFKIMYDYMNELRQRRRDFQRTIREIEYVVEAENASLPRLAWSLDDE